MKRSKVIKFAGEQFTVVFTTLPPEPSVGLLNEQVEDIHEIYWQKEKGMDFNVTELFFALCDDQKIREVENLLLA